MRRMLTVALAVVLATVVWTAGARSAPRDGTVVVPVDLQPAGDEAVSGVVRLVVPPGEPARVLVGLLLPATSAAGDTVRFAVGASACGDASNGPGALRPVGRPLRLSGPGATVVEGVWDDSDIVEVMRSGRSLVLVGDWDGDGTYSAGACGDLDPLRVVRRLLEYEGILYLTPPPSDRRGEADSIVHSLAGFQDGTSNTILFLTGLAPSTGYVAGLSDRTCAAVKDDPDKARLGRLGAFGTDGSGAAHISFPFDLHVDARSVVVGRRAPGGSLAGVARCIVLEDMPVIPM